jgi:putative acetyltransferase
LDDVIAIDDPRRGDVVALLAAHLAFANEHSPPEDIHALDVERLCAPEISFVSFRRDGELLGVGALKRLSPDHAEIKSMHTAKTARRQGVARTILRHLLAMARANGISRVNLETGAMPAFAPAHALYESEGFVPCGSFGDYSASRNSRFYETGLLI